MPINGNWARVPDLSSRCQHCDLPGTDHVDGKCPFEASQFLATRFVDTPTIRFSLSTATATATTMSTTFIMSVSKGKTR